VPWTAVMPLVRASSATALPTALAMEALNVAATAMAAGNWVTLLRPLARPSGPSDNERGAMHSEGTPVLRFCSGGYVASTTKDVFSARVILARTSLARAKGVLLSCRDSATHGHAAARVIVAPLATDTGAGNTIIALATSTPHSAAVVARPRRLLRNCCPITCTSLVSNMGIVTERHDSSCDEAGRFQPNGNPIRVGTWCNYLANLARRAATKSEVIEKRTPSPFSASGAPK
jgi:hypothetical protein